MRQRKKRLKTKAADENNKLLTTQTCNFHCFLVSIYNI